MQTHTPEFRKRLFSRVGFETVDFAEVRTAICPTKTNGKRWGGDAPQPFPVAWGSQGAVWTTQNRRFQARLLKIKDFGLLKWVRYVRLVFAVVVASASEAPGDSSGCLGTVQATARLT
jgi:hypothetical protein